MFAGFFCPAPMTELSSCGRGAGKPAVENGPDPRFFSLMTSYLSTCSREAARRKEQGSLRRFISDVQMAD